MKLTIVILSYNVKGLLRDCLRSIKNRDEYQIIVVDNASADGSADMVKKEFPRVKLLESKTNTGFAKGNNMARPYVNSEYVLFLNPDTIIRGRAIEHCLKVLEQEKHLGAITCKVELPDGSLDYSCHRGLPTVGNTLLYWLGLPSGYKASGLDINQVHDIECITGAFFMTRKTVLDNIGWWDEDYWWNGDDIEICYKIKKAGYKIRYDPREKIIHYKGSSSGLWSTARGQIDQDTKIRAAKSAAKAMGIFVRKHQSELGPYPLVLLVKLGIYLLETYRLAKIKLGLKYA